MENIEYTLKQIMARLESLEGKINILIRQNNIVVQDNVPNMSRISETKDIRETIKEIREQAMSKHMMSKLPTAGAGVIGSAIQPGPGLMGAAMVGSADMVGPKKVDKFTDTDEDK